MIKRCKGFLGIIGGWDALRRNEKGGLMTGRVKSRFTIKFYEEPPKLQKLLENPHISAQIAQSAQTDNQTHLNSISYTAILSKFL